MSNDQSDWRRGEFLISTDKSRIDLALVHGFLSQASYWAARIPLDVVRRSIENSLAFGIYHDAVGSPRQIGFARVVTDCATFAWLSDVFILPEFRGRGLSKWLMEVITAHPQLQGLRRWLLATADAYDLYVKFGFKPLAKPERFMERHFPSVYGGSPAG